MAAQAEDFQNVIKKTLGAAFGDVKPESLVVEPAKEYAKKLVGDSAFIFCSFCRDEYSNNVATMPTGGSLSQHIAEYRDTLKGRNRKKVNAAKKAGKQPEGLEAIPPPVFSFNGLAGVCTCGRTAYKAGAHHVPTNPDKPVVLVGGPHIALRRGWNNQYQWGQLKREGQNADSPTCGAAHALLEHLNGVTPAVRRTLVVKGEDGKEEKKPLDPEIDEDPEMDRIISGFNSHLTRTYVLAGKPAPRFTASIDQLTVELARFAFSRAEKVAESITFELAAHAKPIDAAAVAAAGRQQAVVEANGVRVKHIPVIVVHYQNSTVGNKDAHETYVLYLKK